MKWFLSSFCKRIHNRLAAASESGLRKPVQEERTGFPPPLYPSFSHSPSNTVRSEQASSWNFPPQVKDGWVPNAALSLSRHNAQAHWPVAPVLPPTSVRPPWVFFFSSPSIQFFQSILSKSCPQEFLLHDFCELKPNLHDFPVKICDESWSIAINFGDRQWEMQEYVKLWGFRRIGTNLLTSRWRISAWLMSKYCAYFTRSELCGVLVISKSWCSNLQFEDQTFLKSNSPIFTLQASR